ncbi:MAG: sigma-70 family RNA polymerase sigma factor [Planctomycetota bacterium]
MPVQSDVIVRVLMQQRAELIGYAWLAVADPDLAEDVFQEVSVAAIRKADEINDEDHLIGWLYQAIRLQGLKVRRDRSRRAKLLSSDVLEALADGREARPTESAKQAALRECVNRLQGVTRDILEMRYGQNLKPAAIAKSTGKNIQTIYKSITRAHTALRDCVNQRLAKDGGDA